MKHVKSPSFTRHRAQLSGLISPDPFFSGKTNVAALFSAPEFLMRAREERHMRRTEMSLIWVHRRASQLSYTLADVSGFPLCLFSRRHTLIQQSKLHLNTSLPFPKDTHEELALDFLVCASSQDCRRHCHLNSRQIRHSGGSQRLPLSWESIWLK